MPHQPSGRRPGLAWALLGLTVLLAAASLVIGSVRGETWNEQPGSAHHCARRCPAWEFSTDFPHLRDPVTVVAPLVTAYNLSQELGLLVLLAGVISMIVRFRRSGAEQRLQLKWVLYATAVAGRGRPRRGAVRPADRREQRRRTRPHLGVDRQPRPGPVLGTASPRPGPVP
jgi:hypothetical protein